MARHADENENNEQSTTNWYGRHIPRAAEWSELPLKKSKDKKKRKAFVGGINHGHAVHGPLPIFLGATFGERKMTFNQKKKKPVQKAHPRALNVKN
jgi:hypothetical protein